MITLDLEKYTYHLPDERIARFPVEPRDTSKLLVYKNETIKEDRFYRLVEHLPKESFLVFNNTKVIPARLFFQKESGAIIEIFLLNPVEPSTVISQVMETTRTCTWACMIGNKKRLKGKLVGTHTIHTANDLELVAELVDSEKNYVQFSWNNPTLTFAEIVKYFGQIPLPPYLKRQTEEKDYQTYQTVYSKNDGAVAAPTAGLHFTEKVLFDLVEHDINYDFITLHVGAGTFQPIKVQNVVEHQMHSEQIVFDKAFIEQLARNLSFVIPVGTTSMRSLESLYWFGVKLLQGQNTFFIEKLFPYQQSEVISAEASIKAILDYMDAQNIAQLVGETEIFIFPGYQFRICKGIITNFHQPDSTLILLVAALVGDNWQKIYDFALENNFRFLSYGDSSLLIP
ncbi:S-adenosylmethionine:tRNA ribosyltransferase-isomerase [Emticicia soli]|uniref:S-adenosylmethionine:tRNA ribosyltransferase-isomerase n=1 Tax=Emticicia soli TaxID=2027878 RepID=A0ABW5J674_9BACT